ncbi:DEKNAAC101734 [Brettanomyces naardenensis]|uniref:DEKNAAC101734 n=1 Tax=Brettanomyces naardenensis TaxID=13370 RepID=A0A448YIX1_BRENA|nr:DEKNAAC101734 [Brettanomyces naardenensis]
MAASNILGVLTPPEKSRVLTGEEAKDCIPCQIMGSFTAMAAGGYFSSGRLFREDKDFIKNPQWWRQGVKYTGWALIGLGIFRGGQGWLWSKDRQYREVKMFSK